MLEREILSSVMCSNGRIALGWPGPRDFDSITVLRNRLYVRKWFIDDRPIDLEDNRRFLAGVKKGASSAVLVIRWAENGMFLGTVGWSDWDKERRVAQFGRLAVELRNLRFLKEPRPHVATEACFLLMEFAFANMGLNALYAEVLLSNKRSIHLCERIGMQRVAIFPKLRPTGEPLEMARYEILRPRWQEP